MDKNIQNHSFFYEVIDAISSLEVDELLTKVDIIVAKITHADSTGIYTLDEKTQSVILRASKLHFDIVGKLKMRLGEGITGCVAKYGKKIVIEKNANKDSRFVRIKDLPDDLYESFLSVPIKSGNVIMGVINVKHRLTHRYTAEEITLLEMVGKLIGRAIERAELLEKTKSLEEAIATQKAINRAKGTLMEKMNITENEAYLLIQKQATKERKSMKEISEAVITSFQILENKPATSAKTT